MEVRHQNKQRKRKIIAYEASSHKKVAFASVVRNRFQSTCAKCSWPIFSCKKTTLPNLVLAPLLLCETKSVSDAKSAIFFYFKSMNIMDHVDLNLSTL